VSTLSNEVPASVTNALLDGIDVTQKLRNHRSRVFCFSIDLVTITTMTVLALIERQEDLVRRFREETVALSDTPTMQRINNAVAIVEVHIDGRIAARHAKAY